MFSANGAHLESMLGTQTLLAEVQIGTCFLEDNLYQPSPQKRGQGFLKNVHFCVPEIPLQEFILRK